MSLAGSFCRSGRALCSAAWLFSLVTFTAPMAAQESRGSIVGRVTDSSGAVMSRATVTAINQSTGVEVRAVSNAEGNYEILFLNPGLYTVSVEAAGFRTVQRKNVEVRISDRIGLDFTVEPGSVTEKIEVTAETPLLETATASEGQVFSNRSIDELPIPHGSVRALFFAAAGVGLAGGGNTTAMKFQDPSRPASSSWLTFNGSPTGSTEFTLDGVPNTQTSNSDFGIGISNQPPGDAIQEVRLETAFDASVGHTSGSRITMVLKSGANNLHGTAYFFYRNPALNANSFLSNMTGQAPTLFSYERGGFSLNGPVWAPRIYNGRNRTFFSYTYEIMNDFTQGYPLYSSVPPLDQRTGDFSALLRLGRQYQIYDPASTAIIGGTYTRQPIPGNIIPGNRIDPIASKIVNYWPKPNATGQADGTNNYSATTPSPNLFQNHLMRFDHTISSKQRVYGHYTQYFKKEGPYRDYFENLATGQMAKIQPFNVAVDDTYLLGPHFVVDVRYGFQRFQIASNPKSTGFDLSTLGFSQSLVDQLAYRMPLQRTFPRIDVSGVQSLQTETPNFTADDIHSLFVDFHRPVGNHALRFGAEGRVYRKNAATFPDATLHYTFSTSYTVATDGSASAPSGVGQGMAAFLLGQPTGGTINISDTYSIKSSMYGAYLQDDWRIFPKLLLTLGLRYEYAGPMSERFNRSTRGFDPSATLPITARVEANYAASPVPELPTAQFRARGGLLFAGDGGQPHTLYPPQKRDFMPRIGFSSNPFRNTVIRGGYGIFFLDNGVVSRLGPYQLGYSQTTNILPTLDNARTFVANLGNPFPSGIKKPTGNSLGAMTYAGLTVNFFDTGLRTPYMQRWTWFVQQLMPGRFSLKVGYAGSRSTGLRITKNYNGLPNHYLSTLPVRDQVNINRLAARVSNPFYPILPDTSTNLIGQTAPVSQLLLPFPQFTGVTTTSSQGYSWYHSMQVFADRRFAKGLSLQGSYTFSKQMDAITYLNAGDDMPYRTISGHDRPHRVGVTAIYELPFGRGRAMLANAPAALRQVVSGWQVAFVFMRWSGSPLSFGDIIFKGDIKDVPLPSSQRSVLRWFNTGAGFVTASNQQLASHLFLGPLYYSGIRADGSANWDSSLLRYIRIRENVRVQIRAEALNACNHPSFAPPNTSVTSAAFGAVNTENKLPRIFQFAVKVVF
jgi:hypothetical protein